MRVAQRILQLEFYSLSSKILDSMFRMILLLSGLPTLLGFETAARDDDDKLR